jgi:hypothetical protein
MATNVSGLTYGKALIDAYLLGDDQQKCLLCPLVDSWLLSLCMKWFESGVVE